MMSSIRSSHQILLQDVEILAAVSALLLILFALLGMWSVKAAIAPLKPLVAGTLRIAQGDWGHTAPEPSQPVELRELSQAVNRMSLAIRAAFDKERAISEQMRRFVADASHELRTPLTAITGFLALLEGGELTPEETQRGLRAMRREGQRMTRLVHQLLTLSQLDTAPELKVHPVPLHLGAWIEESRPALEAVLGDHPLRVTGRPLPEPILADPDALSEILLNLLENARRFAPIHTPITVEYGSDATGVFLRVRDQGPGLGEDALARAFDRFYRSDPARTGGHSGLGLSIVLALVQAQGGKVEVANAAPPDHGAIFTLHFPTASRPRL
jgi:two-component system OmpR family sensor kinase